MKNTDISKMSIQDDAVISLRQCGHFLHHNAGKDSSKTNAELLAVLTEDEAKMLSDLLRKCLNHWKTL